MKISVTKQLSVLKVYQFQKGGPYLVRHNGMALVRNGELNLVRQHFFFNTVPTVRQPNINTNKYVRMQSDRQTIDDNSETRAYFIQCYKIKCVVRTKSILCLFVSNIALYHLLEEVTYFYVLSATGNLALCKPDKFFLFLLSYQRDTTSSDF